MYAKRGWHSIRAACACVGENMQHVDSTVPNGGVPDFEHSFAQIGTPR